MDGCIDMINDNTHVYFCYGTQSAVGNELFRNY